MAEQQSEAYRAGLYMAWLRGRLTPDQSERASMIKNLGLECSRVVPCVCTEEERPVCKVCNGKGTTFEALVSAPSTPGPRLGSLIADEPGSFARNPAFEVQLKREAQARADAFAILVTWLTKPATTRYVNRMQETRSGQDVTWLVELSAGGFMYRSSTQETLAGAIRSAVQAAETGAL